MGIICIIIIDNDPIGHYNHTRKANKNYINKEVCNMTIKQLHEITPPKTTIYVGHGGNCRELDRLDPVDMAAYGPYIIGRIVATGENELEIDIKTVLLREE